MNSTASVVTRDNGVKLSNTIGVGGLNTTEAGRIETTLSTGRDTRVNTSGIAVPDVNQEILNGSAARGIDELKVEMQRNTSLAISNVGPDQFARDKVRSNGDFWD